MYMYGAGQMKEGDFWARESSTQPQPKLLLIFQTDKEKPRERRGKGHSHTQPEKVASAVLPLEKADFNGQALLKGPELCVSWRVTYFSSPRMNSASVLSSLS